MPEDENYFNWIADTFAGAARIMILGFLIFTLLGAVYALGREDGSITLVTGE